MYREDEKGKRFAFLISRIDDALKNGYYVETMAITYALLEERTYRLLDRLNISYRSSDKIYQCLEKLKKVISEKTISVNAPNIADADLITYLENELINSGLIDEIDNWRKKRNDVIHDLAKTNIAYSDLEEFSKNGRDVFARYTAFIMRLKKKLS